MKTDWLKKTILFLTGQSITLFGSMLVQFAITWHITLTTKSGIMLTIVIICGFAPQVLISLFAGVWADRYSRKGLIILADSMTAVATAILAVLFTLGFEMIWLLFVFSAIRSVGAGIQSPAVGAFLPDIAPKEKLLRINGINASIQAALMLVAPVAAGGLYVLMGLKSVFWVDVATAAIGISLLLLIPVAVAQKPPETQQPHVLREMTGGLSYVFRTKWLRQFLGFYLAYAMTFGPVVFLTPLMVARSFGEEPWRLVVHEVVFALGATIGGIAVGLIASRFRNKSYMVIGACTFFGLTTFIMGFSPNFLFYLAVMFPMGLLMPFINSGSITILQTKTHPEYMGRVFSLVTIIGSGAAPLSLAAFGPASDWISVEILLILTGAIMAGIALITTRFKEMVAAGILAQENGDISNPLS
jgi:DHA3 family macrolide efflux protein-like MFS transporter